MEIRKEIVKLLEEVKVNRRYLHMYPEIRLDTKDTKNYLISKIRQYGDLEIEEGYAENGFVAFLRVNDTNECVAFRSDIDALPIQEVSDLSFKSKKDGYSHACGHDGHMAILLSTIQYLIKHKHLLKTNILFVFQPGEESPGGAKPMIKQGLFEKYKVSYIFGTHVSAEIEKGKISCCSGPMMARNGEMSIKVHGKSAHGAMAYQGVDAIVAASALVIAFQSIVSRNIDPLKSTVISVGMMHGGSVRNQICDLVSLEVTLRSFHDDSYELQKKRIYEVIKGIELTYNVSIDVNIEDYYLVVDNDAYLNDVLYKAVKEDYVIQKPKMIAEDFSFYQKEVPGLFYFTGIKDENHQLDLHHCSFNFDEEALLYAIETNIRLLESLGALYD